MATVTLPSQQNAIPSALVASGTASKQIRSTPAFLTNAEQQASNPLNGNANHVELTRTASILFILWCTAIAPFWKRALDRTQHGNCVEHVYQPQKTRAPPCDRAHLHQMQSKLTTAAISSELSQCLLAAIPVLDYAHALH